MILVDANLLVYATVQQQPQHAAARKWWLKQIESGHRIGLPWQSLLAFLRICTDRRVYSSPVSISTAYVIVEGWLDLPMVWVPEATDRHSQLLGRLLDGSSVSGNLVPDANLAALALEHGLELYSTDGDFARFEGLRWRNPLRR